MVLTVDRGPEAGTARATVGLTLTVTMAGMATFSKSQGEKGRLRPSDPPNVCICIDLYGRPSRICLVLAWHNVK